MIRSMPRFFMQVRNYTTIISIVMVDEFCVQTALGKDIQQAQTKAYKFLEKS